MAVLGSNQIVFRRIRLKCAVFAMQGGRRIVLVTGAAGFIGQHVALALEKRGDGVVGLDNFNSYYPVALKRARQANLRANNM